jgi:exodeoxyribonuclease VII large subunit
MLQRDKLRRLARANALALTNLNQGKRSRFDMHAQRLAPRTVTQRIAQDQSHIHEQSNRLQRAISHRNEQRKTRLERSSRLLKSLSYRGVLERGFAVIKDEGKKAIASITGLEKGAAVIIQMHDGETAARIGSGTVKDPARAKPALRRPKKGNEGQGSLF